MLTVFAAVTHLTVVDVCHRQCVGIVLAVRRCMMPKMQSVSVYEFALLLARIKRQSSSIIDLVLSVFGGKLHSDGKLCLIYSILIVNLCRISLVYAAFPCDRYQHFKLLSGHCCAVYIITQVVCYGMRKVYVCL